MSIELWLTFIAASAALLALPGPTITVVIGHAISAGRQSVWATVPGVVLGDCVAMTASLLGAGAILAASATLFTALKLAGAAYLIWLGIGLWRKTPNLEALDTKSAAQSNRSIFWNCFVVTAFNPKDIVFFVAFVPQFISSSHAFLPQIAILELTFLAMVGVNVALWSLAASQLRTRLARPGRVRQMNRISGSVLIGAGLLTARA
ncbi:LysE family translocator [Roseibium algae]|uniref:LysE family translocator n=1 Tax=Roseibium algae TaxID=3123038 RepID=A0ABU8TMQ0_9HYPH